MSRVPGLSSRLARRPARVLFVHNSELVAGGNRVLLGLIDHLPRQRFAPFSLVPRRGPLLELLAARGVPATVFDPVGAGSRWSTAARLGRLALALAGRSFDLLHAVGAVRYRGPSLVLPRAAGICHLHAPAGPEETPRALRWAFRRRPRLLLACGEAVARSWREALNGAGLDLPCEVLSNAVDADRFTPSPPPASLRAELGLDGKGPVVSLVGSLSEHKGVADFLAIAAHVPAALFLVVGEEIAAERGFRRRMEEEARRAGLGERVRFLGFRRDVVDLLRASDVVVLPSSREGMPLALLEAAACGKPAVAYDIPGVDEVLQQEETGRLVPPGDVGALARAVEELLAAPARAARMGVAARRLAVERFSLPHQAKRLVEVYDRLLAARRDRSVA